jgi:phosphatidate cytidylyltransferase
MLRKRIITAVLGLPLLIAAVWFGKPWFTLFVIGAAILGVVEFYRLASAANTKPLIYFGAVWTILLLLTPYCPDARASTILVTAGIIISLIWILFRFKSSGSTTFSSWAWTVGGVLYIGWMLTYWLYLRDVESGRWWVFLAFLTVFACDTAAFFVGRAWGKHALAAPISPKKTLEGAIGGLIASIVVCAGLGILFALPLTWWQLALLGAGIGVLAQIGDLIESLLKRNTCAKDAGNLLPGHGGILDRLDSLLFVGAFVYYIILFGKVIIP